MLLKKRLVFFAAIWLCIGVHAYAAEGPSAETIASAHPLATQAGLRILEQGGNAFDAAVAVTAALAVVEPYSSGLGGGGFYLLHREVDGFEVMLDGREKAPGAAHKTMYLDKDGAVVDGLSINGPLAAGIPGIPAAMVHLAKQYGTLPLQQTLQPAIDLAKNGFAVDAHYLRMVGFRLKILQKDRQAAAIFLFRNNAPPADHRIVQKDLAKTLQSIAAHGHKGFYEGAVAKALIKAVKAAGGIWTLQDLKDYQVVERKPITGEYLGIKITTAAPPSSGGIALITMLNILQTYPLQSLQPAQRDHLIVEAMRRAYRDRAEFLGDPDFVNIPVERLTHPMYAQGLRAGINWTRATASSSLPGPIEPPVQGPDTTHFSVLDRNGNRVSATLSINYPFGACVVAAGTGVLLNDEMDDFVAKAGVPNAYGLVGAAANAIEPGKRPLSSMTPTFIDGPQGVAVLGAPGGSRIITMVLRGILSYADGKKPDDWVREPRFHHQYLPDVIQYEDGAFSPGELAQLQSWGHQLELLDYTFGNMQALLWDKKTNTVYAASDPRGVGRATVQAVISPQ